MISYRLYCLRDGRIVGTSEYEAQDDVAAIEAARGGGHSDDCELWSDNRLVAFIPTGPPGEDT